MDVKSIVCVALLGTVIGCAEPPVAAITAVSSREVPLRVTRGEFRDVLYVTGEVESAGGETIVVPRIPNWQTTVRTMVEDGARVEAGDVVAELDSTQFSSGLEQRKQSLADSVQSIAQQMARNEAELKQRQFDLEEKRVALDKARDRAAIPKEILALREWEENQLALMRAEAQFEKTTNELESQAKAGEVEIANLLLTKASAEREIAIAEAAISALTLRAETSGVVVIGEGRTGRKLQTGDTVWVGMKLATIPDLSALMVKGDLIDVDDGRIDVGMPVEVVVDAFPQTRFRGTVSSIAVVAEPLTRESLRQGFRISIELEDGDRELLRPGYSVRAAVERIHVPDSLLVPRAAVDFSGDEPAVYNRDGGRIDSARIGECNAQFCIAASGLEEGVALGVPPGGVR